MAATEVTDRKASGGKTPILNERFHRENCPATRVEEHRLRRPPVGEKRSAYYLVTRCIDCGGQTTRPEAGSHTQ